MEENPIDLLRSQLINPCVKYGINIFKEDSEMFNEVQTKIVNDKIKTFKVWRMTEVWYSTEVEAESEEDAINLAEEQEHDLLWEEGNINNTEVYNVVELDEDGDEEGDILLFRDGERIGDLLDIKGYTVNYELK